jgi:starvation-inducible outer membrane lipoprotein
VSKAAVIVDCPTSECLKHSGLGADMKLRQAIGVVASGMMLASCAQAPEEVRAAYTSSVAYESWTCKQLGEEQARLQGALTSASAQQSQTRANDVAGWVFLGMPVASMSGGNVAPEIANYKGQIEAVQQTMIRKNCSR